MSEIININGPVNFMKLKNSKYEIYIFSHDAIDSFLVKCDNVYESIDIDKYLINLFRTTKNNYNFYVSTFNDYINYKKYKFTDQILKIENNSVLFKNINFKKFKIDSLNLNIKNFFNSYYARFYFNRKEINYLIFDLNNIINECNLLLNINNISIKEIKNTNHKIILNNIFNNYFKNKIKIIIDNCKKLLEYIDSNKYFLKVKLIVTDERYNVLKNIYKFNNEICTSFMYIDSFIDAYNIIIQIINQKIEKNIISNNIINTCILVYLLINYFNFEISYISNSDKIIDNGTLIGTNKIFKNINILNTSTINFLQKYLTNEIKHISVNCINIDKYILI